MKWTLAMTLWVAGIALAASEFPSDAPGYPSRSTGLDALPGFQRPPPGYGQVPFWWWSGDDLDTDRLLWQLRQLHEKGISGVQVNYSHSDAPGWPTDPGQPGIFTDAWWKVYSRVSEECATLNMGIGLSTYTLDWPNGARNLFHELFYSKPELNAIELVSGKPLRVRHGETKTVPCTDGLFAARAYEVCDGTPQTGGLDLTPLVSDGQLSWTAPEGGWEIWTFRAARKPGTLNPLMTGAGETVIGGFFAEFQDHNPGGSSRGLNFFFNDELKVGLGKFAWNSDLPDEFRRRKGYDLLEVLPAMWTDMGDITPKVRIDYADVRMALMEERYFQPIHHWHDSRGILYGCDNHGRGLDPHAYGDYFRACRWYTAPGHDTPLGRADPIKGKVSSSIANLYQRPRVWLEGYHSLGWGATPADLMFATRENYLHGCTLLSLHGLYYSTRGSHWEWAPPCYHFRMPYWEHMDVFLKYFERLSYLMSQGHHVCDVAVIYPVTPYEAEMNGDAARDTAFEIGTKLMAAGIGFDFIDHQSVGRAEVVDGRLTVRDAQASYRALVFPNMEAVRWNNLEKAAAFADEGGLVLAVGKLPFASDRAGRNDPNIGKMLREWTNVQQAEEAVGIVQAAFTQEVRGIGGTVRALHRKVGIRDIYLVMDATPGQVVEFRATGKVELWDPWTGDVHPLRVVKRTATGTQVELPLEAYEAQVVVFTTGEHHQNPPPSSTALVDVKTLPVEDDWRVSFEPTMDNRFGDFRLPVTEGNQTIGIEARRFKWARENTIDAKTAMLPDTDVSSWQSQLHGYGPQFYQLTIPKHMANAGLDEELLQLAHVDPSIPVVVGGQEFYWNPYDFSWRYGKEGDPGHQGFHGLKGVVSENFIRLGKTRKSPVGVSVIVSGGDSINYLWTTVTLEEPVSATIHASQPAPAAGYNYSPVIAPTIFIDGKKVGDAASPVSLEAGSTPILLHFDESGESHFALRRNDVPEPAGPQTLAMRWYKDPGIIPFDIHAGESSAEWFRFVSAPGTTAIRLQAESRAPEQAWIDGEPMIDKGSGRYEAPRPVEKAAVVTLRLVPMTGRSGGAAIPEPVSIETGGKGLMSLGDWSEQGVLNNYSGGVRYRTTVHLGEEQAGHLTWLDLGRVVATAEVRINGRMAGVRVAPPWRLDVAGLLRPGSNTLEVLVYNTLANHYQTIPSQYRGAPVSGLLGPVRLLGRTVTSEH